MMSRTRLVPTRHIVYPNPMTKIKVGVAVDAVYGYTTRASIYLLKCAYHIIIDNETKSIQFTNFVSRITHLTNLNDKVNTNNSMYVFNYTGYSNKIKFTLPI